MVSLTVLVVSVFEVIEPCVKLGTTGTAIAVGTFTRAEHITHIATFTFDMHFSILNGCQVVKKVIYHLIVNVLVICPVAVVPAPPAVSVISPEDLIVPAKPPA